MIYLAQNFAWWGAQFCQQLQDIFLNYATDEIIELCLTVQNSWIVLIAWNGYQRPLASFREHQSVVWAVQQLPDVIFQEESQHHFFIYRFVVATVRV